MSAIAQAVRPYRYWGQHRAPLRREQLMARLAFVAFGLGLPVVLIWSAILLRPTGI